MRILGIHWESRESKRWLFLLWFTALTHAKFIGFPRFLGCPRCLIDFNGFGISRIRFFLLVGRYSKFSIEYFEKIAVFSNIGSGFLSILIQISRININSLWKLRECKITLNKTKLLTSKCIEDLFRFEIIRRFLAIS